MTGAEQPVPDSTDTRPECREVSTRSTGSRVITRSDAPTAVQSGLAGMFKFWGKRSETASQGAVSGLEADATPIVWCLVRSPAQPPSPADLGGSRHGS